MTAAPLCRVKSRLDPEDKCCDHVRLRVQKDWTSILQFAAAKGFPGLSLRLLRTLASRELQLKAVAEAEVLESVVKAAWGEKVGEQVLESVKTARQGKCETKCWCAGHLEELPESEFDDDAADEEENMRAYQRHRAQRRWRGRRCRNMVLRHRIVLLAVLLAAAVAAAATRLRASAADGGTLCLWRRMVT